MIETERLIISELSSKDSSFILELYNDPDFIKYISDRGIRTETDAKQFIESGPRASYAEHGHGLYLVQLKDGTSIGICGLLKRDNLDGPDIGFAMLPSYRRNGYTFEAAQAAIKDGQNRFGFERIMAITSPDNEASIKLLEKLGLSFEKIIRLSADENECKLFSANFPV